MATRSALLAFVFALLLVPEAEAATRVALHDFPRTGGGASHLVLSIIAEGPQHSDIAVAPGPAGPGATVALTVTERAAPLAAGERCVLLNPQTARCGAAPSPDVPFDELSVLMPDGGGRADLRAMSAPRLSSFLVGGTGADVLLGMSAGRNSINAMPAFAPEGVGDVMEGGSGRDTIRSGPGPDRIDGKGGRDRLEYFDRELGIRVNLGRGTAGDGDTLLEVERVQGSPFRDILIGDHLRNELVGFGGNDRLEGRGGDDSLVADPGRPGRSGYDDELLGGDGDDRLDGGRGPDRVLGGRGDDRLIAGPGHDLVAGGPGADLFFAGGGNDRVFSRDGLGEVVDCQDGRSDRVRADPPDRLSGCERSSQNAGLGRAGLGPVERGPGQRQRTGRDVGALGQQSAPRPAKRGPNLVPR